MKENYFELECSSFRCRYSEKSEGTLIQADTLAELADKKPICRICGSDLQLTEDEVRRIQNQINTLVKKINQ